MRIGLNESKTNLVVDGWYGEKLNYPGFSFAEWLQTRWWYRSAQGILSRCGFLRGTLLFICARQSKGVVTVCDLPGFWTFLFLRALLGTPGPCVVLEFIKSRPDGSLRQCLNKIWFPLICFPAVRKGITRAHVMCQWEVGHYAKMFGVEQSRFVHIPIPLSGGVCGLSSGQETRNSSPNLAKKKIINQILSSGGASCDWHTLIKAAYCLPEYKFVIICRKRDYKKLKRITIPDNCELLCNVPFMDHNKILSQSTCYIISLAERECSSGHVRLANAIQENIPIIVSETMGIREYVIDGKTAIVIPHNDPIALQGAIRRLMNNKSLQIELVMGAREFSLKWNMKQYLDKLSNLIRRDND